LEVAEILQNHAVTRCTVVTVVVVAVVAAAAEDMVVVVRFHSELCSGTGWRPSASQLPVEVNLLLSPGHASGKCQLSRFTRTTTD